jgi:hypothetical protein
MGRKKKCELEKIITPKESISDIFEAMNNEEELIKKEKRKYTKKIKVGNNPNNSNSSDQNENNLNFANLDINAKANVNANPNLNPEQIQVKNKVLTEKLSVVDKFYKKYPHLKKDKTNFIKEVLEEKIPKKPQQPYEYALDKIILEDKIYYRDKYNNIMDQDTKLIGFYQNNGNKYEYILFC